MMLRDHYTYGYSIMIQILGLITELQLILEEQDYQDTATTTTQEPKMGTNTK